MHLVILCCLVAVPDRPNPTPMYRESLREQIQGKWLVVQSLNSGNPYDVVKANQAIISFDANWMFLHLEKNIGDFKYATALDENQTPAALTFELISTSAKERPMSGIIKLEGDILTICYCFGKTTTRPTEFASTPGTSTMLWKMKRIRD